MKNMKKIFALVLAALLVLTSFAALADETPASEGTPTATTVTLDPSISVTNLDVGDVVDFYKVIEWDEASGWKFTSDFAGLATSGLDNGVVRGYDNAEPEEIKGDVLKYIAGIPGGVTVSYDGDGGVVQTAHEAILGRINSVLAAEIAKIARGKTAADTETASGESVTWQAVAASGEVAAKAAPTAGLYIALVTPATAGTVYNPIFVSADYDAKNAEGHSNTQSAVLDPNTSYSDSAMAKKTVIDVKKTIEEDPDTTSSREDRATSGTTEGYTATSVDTGEILQFKVATTIPEYNDAYTDADFVITDTLTGLELVIDSEHPFVVKAGDSAITAGSDTYSNDAANEGTSYTIDFTSAYILGLSVATPIEITYYAKITDSATKVINPTDNTVKVEFSNNPGDTTSKGTLIDRTNQYSFSIDANINGHDEWSSSELIKIGVDKNGKPVYKTVDLENGEEDIPALPGATFVLLTSLENKDQLIGKDKATLLSYDGTGASDIYSNTNGKAIVDSSDMGKLNFKGLDVGTYYLVETKAPEGFIRDTSVYKIDISATYTEKEYTKVIDGITVSCKAEVLQKYTIKVSKDDVLQQTSTYEPVYDGDDPASEQNPETGKMSFTNIKHHVSGVENYDPNADHTTLLVNTQGIELPSTGGIGTTLFYVGGGILVLLAVVLLVTKRRMSSND